MLRKTNGSALVRALVVWAGMAVAGDLRAGPVQAGFAERDITPAIGMEQPGGYAKIFHQRLHDPCKVRIALVDDGQSKIVLVSVDALLVPRPLVLAARKAIETATGIPGKAVLIAATHSHSSGPVGMVQPGEYDAAPPEIQDLAYRESSMANAGYLMKVQHEIVAGVRAALEARKPATLGFGKGNADGIAFNRRFRMKNGQTWTHPGAMNPDIVEVAGPVDPEVGVIGAWDADGKLLGVVVNFACHATTNPGGISANWPYFLESTIRGALNASVPVVVFAGTSGDVTQVDNQTPYASRPPAEMAQLVGGTVGAEAVKVLLRIPRSNQTTLDARQRVWNIARRRPSSETVQQARDVLAKGKPKGDPTEWRFAKETLLLDYLVSKESAVEVEVQAIQVGPAVLVTNPAEFFVAYGLEIKAGARFPFTFPVELANGCVGYVPTAEAFSAAGGGYETRLTAYSNLEISAGQQFVDTGIALAREMSPGAVPEFPRLKAAGKAWPTGSNAPQVK